MTNDSNRRNLIRVVVEKSDDGYIVHTTGEQGSGVLTSVAKANGLLVMSENITLVQAGEMVEIQMLDWGEVQ